MRTLIIDNYDSFTYNLAQLVGEISGVDPLVIFNNASNIDEILLEEFSAIILSPGPGQADREADFGICKKVVENSRLPILGVCLGHQGIAHIFGGALDYAPSPMHGRLSAIHHDGGEMFEGITSPFNAVRYHSFIVRDLPQELEATARTDDGLIMAFRHRTRPIWGVQFHPESVETQYGDLLIRNFLAAATRSKLQRSGSMSPIDLANRSHAGRPLVVYSRQMDIDADAEQVFNKFYGSSSSAFWLDSSAVIEGRSRYSFMGDTDGPNSEIIKYNVNSKIVTRVTHDASESVQESIFTYLQRSLRARKIAHQEFLPPFVGGYVGYLGYELKAETGGIQKYQAEQPDAQFVFADRVIAFDHLKREVWLLCLDQVENADRAEKWLEEVSETMLSFNVKPDLQSVERPQGSSFHFFHDRNRYLELISNALKEIADGESYEVCLTNRLLGELAGDPYHAYLALRRANPAPYAAYFAFDGLHLLSCSPERFVSISPNGYVESKPIKGTSRRGRTQTEDRSLIEALRDSEKDRAENLMIVDLIRNDLGKVCVTGSVRVPSFCDIESYRTVHQMVSTVVGELHPDRTPLDCIRALFPGGSMTGAPKIRTMEIIDRLEGTSRGVYSGSIGYLSVDGAVDLNIVIRTAVVKDGRVTIGTGGALVALSDPSSEYDEIVLKSKIIENTLSGLNSASVTQGVK